MVSMQLLSMCLISHSNELSVGNGRARDYVWECICLFICEYKHDRFLPIQQISKIEWLSIKFIQWRSSVIYNRI